MASDPCVKTAYIGNGTKAVSRAVEGASRSAEHQELRALGTGEVSVHSDTTGSDTRSSSVGAGLLSTRHPTLRLLSPKEITALYMLLFSAASEQLIVIVLRCGYHCVESKHLR